MFGVRKIIHRCKKTQNTLWKSSCKISYDAILEIVTYNNATVFLQGRRDKICDLCGKAFITMFRLREHMNVHTKQLQYPCPICDKKLSDRSNMKLHLKVHVSEVYVIVDEFNSIILINHFGFTTFLHLSSLMIVRIAVHFVTWSSNAPTIAGEFDID